MTASQIIDKKFLEDALSDSVKHFTVSEGCKAGDNVAGSLKAIAVTTSSSPSDKPNCHLIFKKFPEQLTSENGFVVFMKAFWREHAVYKTCFPKLVEFAKSRGVEYSAPIPKYYTGFNDDKNDFILMEDVRPAGYIMPDKTKSLTLDETCLIMKEFAKFHAIGYAFIRHEGDRVFSEVEGFQYLVQDPQMVQLMEKNYIVMLRMFFNEAAAVLEPHFPDGAEKMRNYMKDVGDQFNGTMEYLTDKMYFPTICHFDLWANNMLLKHDKVTGKPVGVKFIDFQFTQKGNIFTDLHYTLFTSTLPEFRKQHLDTVLHLYYDTFAETLQALKVPVPWGFSKEFFFDQFNAGFGNAFVRMTFAIPLQLGEITKTEKKDGDDPGEFHTPAGVRKMYSESPLAMARLECLVREMMERKVFK